LIETETFQAKILTWFDQHGRKDLPWQHEPTAYRVWVSEIMLQQTQVAVVISYYQRFMAAFPSIRELAKASQDQVLGYWSGLGYYARARNLHKAAKLIVERHQGEFPADMNAIQALPGIGRSTAGAIMSLAHGQPYPILDGNVKRVLARCFLVEGWPGGATVQKNLWQISSDLTPTQRAADYNQAMMDLGATVCTRFSPKCGCCPLQQDCLAYQHGLQSQYPAKKSKRLLPEKAVQMLLIRSQDKVLLERRPPTGIWGGLWSFPELPIDQKPLEWCRSRFTSGFSPGADFPVRRHTFSHFHLDIHPVEILLDKQGCDTQQIMEDGGTLWYSSLEAGHLGLAAPVSQLLHEIQMNDLNGGKVKI